jgi:hypothetical protein
MAVNPSWPARAGFKFIKRQENPKPHRCEDQRGGKHAQGALGPTGGTAGGPGPKEPSPRGGGGSNAGTPGPAAPEILITTPRERTALRDEVGEALKDVHDGQEEEEEKELAGILRAPRKYPAQWIGDRRIQD